MNTKTSLTLAAAISLLIAAPVIAATITWMQTPTGWKSSGGKLPACPSPLLKTPTSLKSVTTILYPGQTRGGNYKPHGGFRFDTVTTNKVTVMAAMSGHVVRGARYLVDGEIQYTFDIINDCGFMYRIGHLRTLTARFQKIANKFPAATEGDSRTTNVKPPVTVKLGEAIATEVGLKSASPINVFFDFGVYDLRKKNSAAKNATYAATHDAELAQHAICWFNNLPAKDAKIVKSLPPADGVAGKTSDYCK